MVYKKNKTQKSPVVCVSENSKEAWFGWMKKPRVRAGGSQFFFTLYRSIYYILDGSETKCLLYRILGVGDGKKKNKSKKQDQESEMEKKKVVVPNTTMQIPPHCRHLVEVQVFRQSGPSEQRPNGNS